MTSEIKKKIIVITVIAIFCFASCYAMGFDAFVRMLALTNQTKISHLKCNAPWNSRAGSCAFSIDPGAFDKLVGKLGLVLMDGQNINTKREVYHKVNGRLRSNVTNIEFETLSYDRAQGKARMKLNHPYG